LLVAPANGAGAPASEAAAAEPDRPRDGQPDRHGAAKGHEAQRSAPAAKGSAADGVRELRRLLETAPVRRWPLYMRNVKQVIKQVDAAFDERAYGFASIVDLLRAAGREGVLRVERDRQGVLRVFQPEPGAARTRDVQPVEPPAFAAGPPEPEPEPLAVAESDAVPDVADAPVDVPAEPAPARRSRTRRRASATPRTATRAKAR
jgi:hypothetical protein